MSLNSSNKLRPHFIIVGAQKAGSTALHKMLSKHPRLVSSSIKEVNFFNNDSIYNSPDSLSIYNSYFPEIESLQNSVLFYETTPCYLYHPKAAKRIYNFNSKIKIIILLREPAERALSAWTMYHHHFKTGKNAHIHEPRSFLEVIETELNTLRNSNYYTNPISYIKRGIYIDQVKLYFETFPKEQILIIENKELQVNWEQCLNSITSFLKIPHYNISSISANQAKVPTKSSHIEELNYLKRFYKPYNQRLFDFLGVSFNW